MTNIGKGSEDSSVFAAETVERHVFLKRFRELLDRSRRLGIDSSLGSQELLRFFLGAN